MSGKESDFLKRLLATFQGEAEERVHSLASGLIELEKASESGKQMEIVELVFREVHSLKGAARSVNLMEFEAICQAMEDIFDAMKRQKIVPSLPLLDALHQATDVLEGMLATNNAEPISKDRARHAPLIRQLKELARQSVQVAEANAPDREPAPAVVPTTSPSLLPASTPPSTSALLPDNPESHKAAEREVQPAQMPAPIPAPIAATETVRIATARLASLLLQVEELVSAKLAVGQRASELREPRIMLDQWDKRWTKLYPLIRTVSSSLEAIDKQEHQQQAKQNGQSGEWQKLKVQVSSLLEFLEWNHKWVETLDIRLTAIATATNRDQRTIGGMVDHLLQDMKQVLMLPFSSILEIFPSVTRDLARQQDKEVQIVIRGAEIEVDRRILQEIKDPLMHLVRNCIDHAIEMPEVRERGQKPRRGTITLTVEQRDSSKFEILIADDGGGIDLVKVRNIATRLGLISTETAGRE